jgi:hypothetical protein
VRGLDRQQQCHAHNKAESQFHQGLSFGLFVESTVRSVPPLFFDATRVEKNAKSRPPTVDSCPRIKETTCADCNGSQWHADIARQLG